MIASIAVSQIICEDSFLVLRTTPREEDGGWLETIGSDHPQYEAAKRAYEEGMRRFSANIGGKRKTGGRK